MGGHGSGRHQHYGAKTTVEDCWDIDTAWMAREGMFDGSGRRSGSIRWSDVYSGEQTSSMGYEVNAPERWIRLHYHLVRGDESFDYKVPLTTSPLPWGGDRWWFICVLHRGGQYCGRRVGKLYLPPGGRYYGCRHCYDLTYRSSQRSGGNVGYFAGLARRVGASGEALRHDWDQSLLEEGRLEQRTRKNEQRRRRRKARGWA